MYTHTHTTEKISRFYFQSECNTRPLFLSTPVNISFSNCFLKCWSLAVRSICEVFDIIFIICSLSLCWFKICRLESLFGKWNSRICPIVFLVCVLYHEECFIVGRLMESIAIDNLLSFSSIFLLRWEIFSLGLKKKIGNYSDQILGECHEKSGNAGSWKRNSAFFSISAVWNYGCRICADMKDVVTEAWSASEARYVLPGAVYLCCVDRCGLLWIGPDRGRLSGTNRDSGAPHFSIRCVDSCIVVSLFASAFVQCSQSFLTILHHFLPEAINSSYKYGWILLTTGWLSV